LALIDNCVAFVQSLRATTRDCTGVNYHLPITNYQLPITTLLITAAVALGAIVSALPSATRQGSPIDRAAWIAGCWELRATNRLTHEMWMPPAGGSMMGASRTASLTATREFEHLRITTDGARLVYTALPSGQRETSFPSTQLSDTLLVFENLQHDFPQRIIYRRRGTDSVIARVEGPGPNNTMRGFNIPMRRSSCTEPPAPPSPPDTLMMDIDVARDGRLAMVKAVEQNWDVFVMNADGSNARKLTDNPLVDYMATWSPDGTRLAYVSVRERNQEIFTMRADGSDAVQLTRGTANNNTPSWSPDGRSIVFQSDRDGRAQVYVMAADGSAQRALTRDSVASAAPSWAPDGRRIYFSSQRAGHNEVFVMNADGTGARQLTTTPVGHSGLAAMSRDGRVIAFWSTRDGNDEVYVMNADGSNPRNITNNSARDALLGWTPDGAYILFRSSRDRAAFELYRMRPDGTEVTRLTTTR
jgi:Tol biopolymer transport system component